MSNGKVVPNTPWQCFVSLFRGENQAGAVRASVAREARLFSSLEISLTFFQSVWLSWVVLFRAPAKVNNPKSFTSKFMTNIWACFCLAFTASYTANLGLSSDQTPEKLHFLSLSLSSCLHDHQRCLFRPDRDHRPSGKGVQLSVPTRPSLSLLALQSTLQQTSVSLWNDRQWRKGVVGSLKST